MTVVGLIIASYGFMQLLFRIPLGIWSDRTGRWKPFLYASLLMLAGSALGLALSPTPEWMIATRALGGLAACSWVVWSVMYAGFFPKERLPAAMSHLGVCSALAGTVKLDSTVEQVGIFSLGLSVRVHAKNYLPHSISHHVHFCADIKS